MLMKIVAGVGALAALGVLYLIVVCPILTLYYGYPGRKTVSSSSGGEIYVAEDDGNPFLESRRAGQGMLNLYEVLATLLAVVFVLYVLGTGAMVLL